MADQTLRDNNRRPIDILRDEVSQVLPAFFVEEFPNFISLLESYYKQLDSDDIGTLLNNLYTLRDLAQVPDSLLPFLEREYLLGENFFEEPDKQRAAVRNSNVLYRSKGSLFSIEQFFRLFYNTDPEVVYTKENVFTLNQSEIGPNSLRFLIDDKLYQTFAILIKADIPISEWRDAYKSFVHPAGMYLGGEVQIVSVGDNILSEISPDATTDSGSGLIQLLSVGELDGNNLVTPAEPFAFTDIVGRVADSSENYIINLNETIPNREPFTFAELEQQYDDIEELLTAESPRFDNGAQLVGEFQDSTTALEGWDSDGVNFGTISQVQYGDSAYGIQIVKTGGTNFVARAIKSFPVDSGQTYILRGQNIKSTLGLPSRFGVSTGNNFDFVDTTVPVGDSATLKFEAVGTSMNVILGGPRNGTSVAGDSATWDNVLVNTDSDRSLIGFSNTFETFDANAYSPGSVVFWREFSAPDSAVSLFGSNETIPTTITTIIKPYVRIENGSGAERALLSYSFRVDSGEDYQIKFDNVGPVRGAIFVGSTEGDSDIASITGAVDNPPSRNRITSTFNSGANELLWVGLSVDSDQINEFAEYNNIEIKKL